MYSFAKAELLAGKPVRELMYLPALAGGTFTEKELAVIKKASL